MSPAPRSVGAREDLGAAPGAQFVDRAVDELPHPRAVPASQVHLQMELLHRQDVRNLYEHGAAVLRKSGGRPLCVMSGMSVNIPEAIA